MGKTLVLAEKPSVGKELAKFLNCTQGGNGYLMGSKYIVTWALGHLVTLADPEAYDEKYKSWRIEDLPMLPKELKLVVIKETSKQYKVVHELLKRADVDELVIATDSGREGELVARWIIQKAGFRKPIKRLWISSQTEKAIRDGFNNLKPGKEYENLFWAAQSRAQADWLIGLNVTRALTCKYNAQLSAGRVQTPTLALIVERENEIKKFIPKDYWTVNGKVNDFTVHWSSKNGDSRTFDKQKAEDVAAKVNNQMGKVVELNKASKKELPPLAYDLTELQRDANRKFGYSAKQTLNLMQRLYENHKILSYPRTDSRHLTTDIVPTLLDRLKSIAIGPYEKFARSIIKGRIHTTSRLVDNSKVSDHHAIIPTEQHVDLSSLNREEKNIYDLVVKRFLEVLSLPFEYEQTTLVINVKGESFSAKGKIVKSKGWKEISSSGANEDKDQSLPPISKGEDVKLTAVRSVNEKTKPPARYNEATLLTAMEHPGKNIEDDSLREALDNTSGLGTPATRADVIEKLFNTFYMERKGKDIHPTSKGIQLIGLVPKDLKSPELTAKWEKQLQLIGKGKANSMSFVKEMREYASKLVGNVVASTEAYKHDNATRVKCPDCGKNLLEVSGKRGKMLVCPDRDCGYRKGVSQMSNARCPTCHKKMEIRGDGDNKIFVCGCGYREKLSAFNKRRESEKSALNKKDVSRFLNQQNKKDEPVNSGNSAMAEAFAKLNLK
ncbi:DNA topoisomerase III [Clostridium estertheticum]|uniref:DNA topoisomerase III n=1 Tax=Clostridium estertheticum TaxID=238834 RepID=UPI001C7CC164|nr:DNA topoisomerase III [Clostridium estertheticum]MBX4261622.1 DNA topoisomerase III [Clostridium estertheticum]WLC70327.1 DNA topoisomerase III [Clostridium estertheticum]